MTVPTRIVVRIAIYGALGVIASACVRTIISPPAPAVVVIAPEPVGVIPEPAPSADSDSPPVIREMRGLWIATVGNLDWPSKPGLSADQQRAELTDILNRAASSGINTIIFQVRPSADALYASSLEPWAALLQGTQGVSPGYDPLAFAIQQAHARGMELHAWINPFRAGTVADSARLAPSHIFHTRRDLIRIYGHYLWLDPGEPDVQDLAIRVVADIVRRYDVDGIHLDDYFYPYRETGRNGRNIEFPDDATYEKYSFGVPRNEWRRANIDRFVERLYREVHAVKPTVKVGLSPFGIWRPGYPAGVDGLDSFEEIFADSRKWVRNGWADYFAPQLYWPISAPQQSFSALLDWWITQNRYRRNISPGLAAYRVNNGSSLPFQIDEIPAQIGVIRTRSGSTGSILFDTHSTLKKDGGALARLLASGVYKSSAMAPASPWLDSVPPAPPVLSESADALHFAAGGGKAVRWWTVRQHSGESWTTSVRFVSDASFPLGPNVDRVLVQAADQAGNLSRSVEWRRSDAGGHR